MTADPKDHARNRQAERGPSDARPDPDNNLGRGAPADREERIRQKARSIEQAPQYRHRAAHDLDREDTELRRAGVAGQKPGVRHGKENTKPKSKG
jgi:hypothetical protein